MSQTPRLWGLKQSIKVLLAVRHFIYCPIHAYIEQRMQMEVNLGRLTFYHSKNIKNYDTQLSII